MHMHLERAWRQHAINRGLLGWFRCWPGLVGGASVHDIVRGNHAYLVGNRGDFWMQNGVRVFGRLNWAALSGGTQRFDVDAMPYQGLEQFTIALTVYGLGKADGTAATDGFFGSWDGIHTTKQQFLRNSGANVQWFVRNSADSAEASVSVTAPSTTAWHRYVLRGDGANIDFSYDGMAASASGSLTGPYFPSATEVWSFGAGRSSQEFTKTFDLKIWNRALSDTEVVADYYDTETLTVPPSSRGRISLAGLVDDNSSSSSSQSADNSSSSSPSSQSSHSSSSQSSASSHSSSSQSSASSHSSSSQSSQSSHSSSSQSSLSSQSSSSQSSQSSQSSHSSSSQSSHSSSSQSSSSSTSSQSGSSQSSQSSLSSSSTSTLSSSSQSSASSQSSSSTSTLSSQSSSSTSSASSLSSSSTSTLSSASSQSGSSQSSQSSQSSSSQSSSSTSTLSSSQSALSSSSQSSQSSVSSTSSLFEQSSLTDASSSTSSAASSSSTSSQSSSSSLYVHVRGTWTVNQGIVRRWRERGLDAAVKAYWASGYDAGKYQALHDGEARPCPPGPYVVFEVEAPLILGHSTGLRRQTEQQYLRTPVTFHVHAKSNGTSGKQIAVEIAKLICAAYDPGNGPLDIRPDKHIQTYRLADYHLREGDEEWVWVIQYEIHSDATYLN